MSHAPYQILVMSVIKIRILITGNFYNKVLLSQKLMTLDGDKHGRK